MSVYLGYNTMTKQYLKDLVSNNNRVGREWTNYYVNVSTTYAWPHGLDNYPCSVRNDNITEDTNITIKTLSFDDVTIAEMNAEMLDVRGRFVKSDKTVITKDLTSMDLSSKFSTTMLRDKTTIIACYVVNEKVNVGDERGSVLFQLGVKLKTSIGKTPELAIVYEIS